MRITLNGTLRRIGEGHFTYEGSMTVELPMAELRPFNVAGFVNDADDSCSFRLADGKRGAVIFEGTWTGQPVIDHELKEGLTLLTDLVLVQCSEYGRSFAAQMQGTDGMQGEYTYAFSYPVLPENAVYPNLLQLCKANTVAGTF